MNILIIKQTSLGDVLNSTVAIKILKHNFPNTNITFLVDKSAYNIMKYNKDINKFIIFDFKLIQKKYLKSPIKVITHIISILKEIRKIHYDMAFDLQGLFRSVFFLYLSKAKKKYVKGRWIFLKKYRNKYIHAIEEIKNTLKIAGLEIIPSKMEIYTSDNEVEKINTLLREINPNNKKMLIISPFTRWNSKNWGTHNYNNLLKLIENNIVIIITGTKDKINETELIFENIYKNNIYNMVGKLNLLELVELIKRADLLLSGDSFPIHVAGAVNTPVISLFGPTDEKRVGPVSKKSIVLRDEVNCKICYKKNCRKGKICMDNIKPQFVYNYIKRFFGVY